MKINPCLLALLTTAFAGTASAQSLTLFGVVDVNAQYVKNDLDRVSKVASDGNSGSRIGFRGTDEIGDGLKAGFHLESAIAPDTGDINPSGKFWHRRSTVSLYTEYGELRLGRDTVPTWLAFVDGDVTGTTGIGDASKTYRALGGADTRLRSDNLVAYFLPSNPWAIYGTIAAAPSEKKDGRRYVGARLGYRAGPIDLSVAYSETSVATGLFKLAIVSGSYDLTWAKIYGVAQKTELLDAANVHLSLGLAVPVPMIGGTFKTTFTRADGQGILETADADQYMVSYVYDLSKRTALYGTASVIENKGTADFTVADIVAGAKLAPGTKSQAVEAGIRHSF